MFFIKKLKLLISISFSNDEFILITGVPIPIIEKLHRHHSQQSDSDSRNLAYYDLEKSGGIKVNNSAGCYYHYDGSLIPSSSIHYPFPLPSSPNYKMADYYFYHAFIPLFQLTLPGEP